MGCNCGSSSTGAHSSGCSKWSAMDTVTPLNAIRNGDENFCFSEITDKICQNLANDEGINPSATNSNNDCDDLKSLNDLATGSLHNALGTLDMCDVDAYKCWLDSLLSWNWNVDKALICAICGLWEAVHCLDGKTQNSVRVVDIWEGNDNVFSLPTLNLSEALSNFDYLDLHLLFGTEHVVGRFSLEGGTAGIPTIVLMDKVGSNTSFGMGPGALAGKELGISFPSSTQVKIDHFIWSITGFPIAGGGQVNQLNTGAFVAFGDTNATLAYNNSQDTAGDKPHEILKIEGIISRTTSSCIGG